MAFYPRKERQKHSTCQKCEGNSTFYKQSLKKFNINTLPHISSVYSHNTLRSTNIFSHNQINDIVLKLIKE
jgi:hypothetical protein